MAKRPPAPPIALIGMAARLPGAVDVEQFWSNLVGGVESITRPRSPAGDAPVRHGDFVPSVARVDDIEMFDADYFRIPSAEAAVMDPQHRVLLETAVAALEDAGYHGSREEMVGVFVGCGENFYLRDFISHDDQSNPVGTDLKILSGNAKDFLAARISNKLGLTGPSINVQTTCSTSLSAVAMACGALAAGDCDIAIAGGVSLLMPDVDGYHFNNGGILSADGRCRAFDAEASGTVPGSGAAVVVLRRDDDAARAGDSRRAVIRGWAVTNDGGSGVGFAAPSVVGQEAAIRSAMSRAGVAPKDVGYVEAHATGTPIGDPIEFEAIIRALGDATDPCFLGAVKPNIGHADAAAGVVGLIKAALVVERGTIPATLHFQAANPAIALDSTRFEISAETRDWPGTGRRVAGVSAFGLGGNNTHVVLEQAQPAPPGTVTRRKQVVVLSARTPGELLEQRTRLARWVDERPALSNADLADVGFTLAVGRPRFQYQWAAAVADAEDLVRRLCAESETFEPTKRWTVGISGTPAELADLGQRLAADEPLFQSTFQRLLGGIDRQSLSTAALAALSSVCVIELIQGLGLRFARIESPRWADTVIEWFVAGAAPDDLAHALAGLTQDEAVGARDGLADVVIDRDFSLESSLAGAWARGATLDWRRYFACEDRRRIPLPTYPFTRRRLWLPRRDRRSSTPVEIARPLSGDSETVDARVAAIWCAALGLATVDHDAHFVDDLAGDSVFAVDIGAELSDAFQLDLPVDLPFLAPTVTESARYIERCLAESLADRTDSTPGVRA